MGDGGIKGGYGWRRERKEREYGGNISELDRVQRGRRKREQSQEDRDRKGRARKAPWPGGEETRLGSLSGW